MCNILCNNKVNRNILVKYFFGVKFIIKLYFVFNRLWFKVNVILLVV